MRGGTPALRCEDLALGYAGAAVATGITFEIYDGDYLCIVGANGSGKSTLIKTIIGLVPPLSGRLVKGANLAPGAVGYLPQRPPSQSDFPASVAEVVRSGLLGRGGAGKKRVADDFMERLGIGDLSGRCYRELSDGQRKRVLLARAMCAARGALLLDEPASGLDCESGDTMYELLSEINRAGVTVVMISHDADACSHNASNMLRLGAGGAAFYSRGALEADGGIR